MRSTLFVFSIFHYWKEMHPVARHFAEQGWRVHVLLGWSGESAAAVAAECRAAGIAVDLIPPALNFGDHQAAAAAAAANTPAAPRRGAHLPDFVQDWFRVPRRLVEGIRAFRRAGLAKRYASDVLDRTAPDVIFGGPWQAAGSFDNGFAFWCRRRRLPYCCLSFSPYMGEANNIGGKFDHLARGMAGDYIRSDFDWINRLVAAFFPEWTRTRDGVTIFYWDPVRTLAAKLHGLVERNIWQRPSESYDVVFAFSEFARRMLIDAHYDAHKIIVAGMPLLDRIVARLDDARHRAAIFQKLGLTVDEPFILYNIEPGLEHSYVPADIHWRRFNEHMAALSATGMKTILSLHPLCRMEDYRFIEQTPGFKVVGTPSIHEIYPYCRLVVSHPCSTNLLAGEFGKPLVIIDHAQFTREGAPRAALFRMPGAFYAYASEELAERLGEVVGIPIAAPHYDGPRLACVRIHDAVEQRFFGPAARPTASVRISERQAGE
jgi:hypothetical protein